MRALRKIKQTLPSRIFNVYKPVGMTSYDVIKHFKYHLPKGYGKIGHFGTLDPFAEGILLIGTGKAPRLNNHLQKNDKKTYVATGVFGIKTPSGDNTCDELLWKKQEDPKAVSINEISELVQNEFVNSEYWQVPPAFSAVKHEGKALYKYARSGQEIVKEPVLRKVYDFKVLDLSFPNITFEVTVGSGTYIRKFIEDIAERFSNFAHLTKLVRTQVGEIQITSALEEDLWPKRGEEFDFKGRSLPLTMCVDYPVIELSELQSVNAIRNGMPIRLSQAVEGDCWLTSEGELLALGQVKYGEVHSKILFDELKLLCKQENS